MNRIIPKVHVMEGTHFFSVYLSPEYIKNLAENITQLQGVNHGTTILFDIDNPEQEQGLLILIDKADDLTDQGLSILIDKARQFMYNYYNGTETGE